jgi:hypothetical protein
MRKIVIVSILGVLFLNACEKSVVSKDYYTAHLNEAKEEIVKCTNDKDENAMSCDNANQAIVDANIKEYEQKEISNGHKFSGRL